MCNFDPAKPVQTRDGQAARIVATDADRPLLPIVALVAERAGGEIPRSYTKTGHFLTDYGQKEHHLDLINVPETRVRYLNMGDAFLSEEGARGRHTDFDTIKVTFTGESDTDILGAQMAVTAVEVLPRA